VDDLGRKLESLTSSATRRVVVPPVEEVRRRARRGRRQVVGAGAAAVAVVAMVVASAVAGGGSPAPTVPAATPTPTASPSASPHPTARHSTAKPSAPARHATLPPIVDSAMLKPAAIGAGWRRESPSPRVDEVRFDPCGDGKLGPKPGSQRVERYTSDEGEVVEHLSAYTAIADAQAAMQAIRSAADRCSGGAVTYADRGSLHEGDDSLLLQVRGGPQDPITTYVSVVREGAVLLTLQDTRVGVPYTESAHRTLVRKALTP
jgi:hypothetical protein